MEDIVSVFNKVLAKCKEINASDVHLCVGTLWKYRLQGQIMLIPQLQPLSMADCEEIVRHIMRGTKSVPEEDLARDVRILQDIDCSYSIAELARFRVNICRQRGTFSVVLRLIPFEAPTIEGLGLPRVINDISMEERGLVLVTGVTGCGKSTTLASMINLINQSKPCKIVTIEDPIEFLHREIKAAIVQREVGSDTESFAKALRAALRQDPNIILVGEMRDRTTIDTALKAAETGHLVLSTLHTVDAPKTIQRIISSFDPGDEMSVRLRLGEALRAVVSQRLLRRKDNAGRVAVVEVMRNTLSIRDCIENPEKSGNMRDYIESGTDQYGMQTFDQHLMDLFNQGVIDLETAKSAATSADDFQRNVQFG
ncbi:MAG: PilT/PilU family type 4a pilus ATPase [Nitrospirae bacterium]|nr:PilT/PilU family type 4a pilus ATPase [Nitrospirota bacterium]